MGPHDTIVLMTRGLRLRLIAAGIFVFGAGTKDTSWSPAVVYPTLSALWLVTAYDMVKYFWLHQRLRHWWLYEHIYKMISAFSALLSAFSGTVLPHLKPYSQIFPSVICVLLIGYFIRQRYRMMSRRETTGRAIAS